jgi:predicted Zn-dependent peptidase
MSRKFVAAAGFACFAALVSAQSLPPGVVKGPSMGGITQYDYPNGLRVLLYPDAAEPKIRALTADQVNAAFRRHIDPASLWIVKADDFKAAGVYK